MKKIAAVDIGSNSFHLIIAQILQNGKLEIIFRDREVLRLSENFTDKTKFISDTLIDKAVIVLKRFKSIAEQYNAEIITAATSSVRESSNQNEFTSKIFDKTGIKINVINGNEESRLIYSGIINALELRNKKCICIDIGGGSTEFIYGKNNNIIYSESLKLGAVRLTQRFFQDFVLNDKSILDCENWIDENLQKVKNKIINEEIDYYVGTSGTILSVGSMLLSEKNVNIDNLNNLKFSRDDLYKIRNKILAAKTFKEREKIIGLDPKRADVFPAGIILLSKIFERLKIKEMIISEYAMREGIIFDSLKK